MSPIIGVIPLFDEEKNSLWMLPGYLEATQKAGGVPVILPLTASREQVEKVCDLCDGFLFTGGHDVDPALYQEDKITLCGRINHARDLLERQIFTRAFRDDKPILGICRGLQLINVLLGGTLYQDLQSQFSNQIEHVMKPPYDRCQHEVCIKKNSPLYELSRIPMIGVNSYHHQGIKELASSLEPMATAEDGLVEAAYCKTRQFLWAVQWHPEYSYGSDELSMRIFERFVESCGEDRE